MAKRIRVVLIAVLSALMLLSAGLIVGNNLKAKADDLTPVLTNYAKNLSFNDSVYVMYAIKTENVQDSDELGMLVWTEAPEKYEIGTQKAVLKPNYQTVNGTEMPVFRYPLAAKQMTDTLYTVAYAKRGETYYYSAPRKYSVIEYAYNKLGKTEATPTTNQNLVALLNGMLAYGGAAQTYFEYNTDRLASEPHTYVKLENATFSDGYDYIIGKVGSKVEITLNEGYELSTTHADYITVEGEKIYLTIPENKTVDKTSVLVHEHNYTELKTDSEYHWYECICGDASEKEGHKGGVASCNSKKVCIVCKTSYGNTLTHSYSILMTDQTYHWYQCECGDKGEMIPHSGGKATCTTRAQCTACRSFYGTTASHNFTTLKSNDIYHWYECSCGEKDGRVEHFGGVATTTSLAKCEVCETPYGEYSTEVRVYVFNLVLSRISSNKEISATLPEGTPTTITVVEGEALILPTATPVDSTEYKFTAWKYKNSLGKYVTIASGTIITAEIFADLDLGDGEEITIDLVAYCTSNWTGFY